MLIDVVSLNTTDDHEIQYSVTFGGWWVWPQDLLQSYLRFHLRVRLRVRLRVHFQLLTFNQALKTMQYQARPLPPSM